MRRPEIVSPKPGQESVWDYPRPPRLEPVTKRIEIVFAGKRIVEAPRSFRVLETSHPPVYYIAPEFIDPAALQPASGSSVCEWKGAARYFDIVANGQMAPRAAWAYPMPKAPFEPIAGHLAFYAGPMDLCTLDGVRVTPQPGQFYGGWITPDITGPFKGEPGTMEW